MRPPSLALDPDPGTQQSIAPFDRRALPDAAAANGRLELLYDAFDEPGTYEIFYARRDPAGDRLTPLVRSVVYRDRPGNRLAIPGEHGNLDPEILSQIGSLDVVMGEIDR